MFSCKGSCRHFQLRYLLFSYAAADWSKPRSAHQTNQSPTTRRTRSGGQWQSCCGACEHSQRSTEGGRRKQTRRLAKRIPLVPLRRSAPLIEGAKNVSHRRRWPGCISNNSAMFFFGCERRDNNRPNYCDPLLLALLKKRCSRSESTRDNVHSRHFVVNFGHVIPTPTASHPRQLGQGN